MVYDQFVDLSILQRLSCILILGLQTVKLYLHLFNLQVLMLPNPMIKYLLN